MHAIDAYARAVVAGKVPAGKYHRLACVRHLRDRAREGTRAFPYRFDLARADRFFRFAAQLKHYKGRVGRPDDRLQPASAVPARLALRLGHQDTGLRRFRTAYNEIPRKNGKSLEAAIVALYVDFFDGEAGAEGYCVATKREQAKIVFNDCKRLVLSSGLAPRIHVARREPAPRRDRLEARTARRRPRFDRRAQPARDHHRRGPREEELAG